MINPSSVVRKVSEYYGVDLNEVFSSSRSLSVAHSRQVCYYVLNTIFHFSTPRIGRMFNRDHSTVVHGINNISKKIMIDEETRIQVKSLIRHYFDHAAKSMNWAA